MQVSGVKLAYDVNAVTDNAAVLQQRVTKGTNPFLSTLAEPGEAQFLTVLKPCGILLPHTHQRANRGLSAMEQIMTDRATAPD
eukprot:jgi/Ulvmu1/9301/UM050_0050.1